MITDRIGLLHVNIEISACVQGLGNQDNLMGFCCIATTLWWKTAARFLSDSAYITSVVVMNRLPPDNLILLGY